MNAADFRDDVVIPALCAIDSYSKAAERLVLGTAMVESNLKYTTQKGGGPALGYFQMEDATHNDIFSNFLGSSKKHYLLDGLHKISDRVGYADELVKNPQYAAAMCRIHYLRDPKPLPAENNLQAMAATWKRWYNSSKGKGTEQRFIDVATKFKLMSL